MLGDRGGLGDGLGLSLDKARPSRAIGYRASRPDVARAHPGADPLTKPTLTDFGATREARRRLFGRYFDFSNDPALGDDQMTPMQRVELLGHALTAEFRLDKGLSQMKLSGSADEQERTMESELMALLGRPRPTMPTYDEAAAAGYLDEMFGAPVMPERAEWRNITDQERAIGVGMALGDLLGGGSLGTAAAELRRPVAGAQRRFDEEYQREAAADQMRRQRAAASLDLGRQAYEDAVRRWMAETGAMDEQEKFAREGLLQIARDRAGRETQQARDVFNANAARELETLRQQGRRETAVYQAAAKQAQALLTSFLDPRKPVAERNAILQEINNLMPDLNLMPITGASPQEQESAARRRLVEVQATFLEDTLKDRVAGVGLGNERTKALTAAIRASIALTEANTALKQVELEYLPDRLRTDIAVKRQAANIALRAFEQRGYMSDGQYAQLMGLSKTLATAAVQLEARAQVVANQIGMALDDAERAWLQRKYDQLTALALDYRTKSQKLAEQGQVKPMSPFDPGAELTGDIGGGR